MPETEGRVTIGQVLDRLVALAESLNTLDDQRAQQIETLQLRVSSLETRLEVAEDYARETRESWPERFA